MAKAKFADVAMKPEQLDDLLARLRAISGTVTEAVPTDKDTVPEDEDYSGEDVSYQGPSGVTPPEPKLRVAYMGDIDMGTVPAAPSPNGQDAPAAEPVKAAEGQLYGFLDRKVLLDAAKAAAKACPRRSYLPVLGCLLCKADDGQLSITGSDMDNTITVSVPFEGSGRALAPAKMMIDTLSAMSDETVVIDGSPEGEFKVGPTVLRGLPAAEYPALTIPETGEATVRLTPEASADLLVGLRSTGFATSKDDARPVITTVAFDSEDGNLRLVATDSYRMALYDTGIPFDRLHLRHDLSGKKKDGSPWLLPAKAVKVMASIMEPEAFTFTEQGTGYARFDAGNTVMVIRLTEGIFPNYRQLIPAESAFTTTVQAPEENMLAALKVLKPIAVDSVPVRLHYEAGRLTFKVIRQETGSSTIPVPESDVSGRFDHNELIAAYNLTYLREGFLAGRTEQRAKGGVAWLGVTDPLKPAMIRSEGGTYRYVLMPVRI